MSVHDEKTLYKASWAGEGVFECLKTSQPFSVIGKTSRGAFLSTENQSIIYLTAEPYLGPLTVNLPEREICIGKIQRGDVGCIDGGCVHTSNMTIQVDSGHIWSAPRSGHITLKKSERKIFLRELCLRAADEHDGSGLSGYLPALFGDNPFHKKNGQFNIEDCLFLAIQETRKRLAENQLNDLVQIMEKCVGLGRGLTPAGDDFIEGVMLALNRWQDVLGWSEGLNRLNQSVVTLAPKKTTSLSANLIQWSTRGQADERIIDVLDAIFTGEVNVDPCVKKILSVGHSSGVDLLTGIATVVLASSLE
jgi:hypothetical protein